MSNGTIQLLDNLTKTQQFSNFSYTKKGYIIPVIHFKKAKLVNTLVGTCHNKEMKVLYQNYQNVPT